MSSQTVAGGTLQTILEPLKERQEEIETELARLAVEYEDAIEPLKEEMKGIVRVLKAADPQLTVTRKKRGEGPPQTRAVAADKLTLCFEWVMAKDTEEEFSQRDFRADTPEVKNTGDVATSFRFMQEDGVIRFVRQVGTLKLWRRTGAQPSEEFLGRLSRTPALAHSDNGSA